MIFQCGACDGNVLVTIEQFRTEDSAPCGCGGHVDLKHARAHADAL